MAGSVCARTLPAGHPSDSQASLGYEQQRSERPNLGLRRLLSDNLGSAAARAARALWSESGGRGGVSDLGGGEQPTAEASAASTSGSPSARTRNVALCARRPRDARWNKSD